MLATAKWDYTRYGARLQFAQTKVDFHPTTLSLQMTALMGPGFSPRLWLPQIQFRSNLAGFFCRGHNQTHFMGRVGSLLFLEDCRIRSNFLSKSFDKFDCEATFLLYERGSLKVFKIDIFSAVFSGKNRLNTV